MRKVDRLRNGVEKVNPIICTAYSMLQYYTATEDVIVQTTVHCQKSNPNFRVIK